MRFYLANRDHYSIIARMIHRRKAKQVEELIGTSPAVALLGPRQVGKTTLAMDIAELRPSIYLDLESDADRAKLAEPELYSKISSSSSMRFIACQTFSRTYAA